MQKAPVMKSAGLAPIDDEPVHVFGRNLEDRVIESKQEDEDQNKQQEKAEREKREQEDDVETMKKRKFETITGEEDEETAFQGDFKLFAWDKPTSNWIEKGRGQLKLNDLVDSEEQKSRLIMRASGTYRIILNVAIQHSFFKVIANTKTSIRFTDSQSVWAASGSNAKQLGDLIAERLKIVAEQAATATEGNGTAPATNQEQKEKPEKEPTEEQAQPIDEPGQEDVSESDSPDVSEDEKPDELVSSDLVDRKTNEGESDGAAEEPQSEQSVPDSSKTEEKHQPEAEADEANDDNQGESKRIKLS